MLRKINIHRTIISGLIAAAVFSIPINFFVRDNTYTESWLLYLGSFLFLVVIWVHTIRENQKRSDNESTIALAFLSHVATITGIIFSVIFSFALLSFLVPGYLGSGNAGQLLRGEPVNIIKDKTDGLSFEVFFCGNCDKFRRWLICRNYFAVLFKAKPDKRSKRFFALVPIWHQLNSTLTSDRLSPVSNGSPILHTMFSERSAPGGEYANDKRYYQLH